MATLTMQTATIGSGPRVVFLGGEITGWQSWATHAERFATTHTVTRVQPLAMQLGGRDWRMPADYSVELESTALKNTLDKTPVDLVAWSYGGLIALDYALDRPESIRSLTLVEPLAFWVLSATNRLDDVTREQSHALRDLLVSMREDVSAEQLDEYGRLTRLVAGDPRQDPSWARWFQNRRSLRTGTAMWDHVGSLMRLEGFPHPLLLIKGQSSAPYLHRIVDALHFSVSRSEVVELAGGHAPHVAAPDAFIDTLTRFLQNARP